MREALARAGGTAARGIVRRFAPQPVAKPFAQSRVVDGSAVAALAVGAPEPAPAGVGFVDGIQLYVVDGHLGLTPVVRAYVDAAVLERRDGALRCAARAGDEFLVVPAARLTAPQRDALEAIGLPVHDSDPGPRPHPLVDLWAATQVIEQRRTACEIAAGRAFLAARPDARLFVDGGVTGLADVAGGERAIGIVKEHETQFLDGSDLAVALTLPAGSRSSVFARSRGGVETHSWYLRLWPWPEEDLLHGLTRIERLARADAAAEASLVSRWLLAERAPIAAPDPRWDRLIYPMHEVEMYLRAHAGGWS
jgi:hypothetical protein